MPGPPLWARTRRSVFEVVILLCGGDKKSQQKDIRTAQQMAKEI